MLPQFTHLFLMDLTRIRSQTFDLYAANEPGFADAMLKAYITAFQAPRNKQLSHDFIQNINRIAMSHRVGTGQYKTVPNNYKVYFQQYGTTHVCNYSATNKGLLEFLTYWRKQASSMHGIQFKSLQDPAHFYLVDRIDDCIVCMNKHGEVTDEESLDTLMVNKKFECIIHSGLSQKNDVMTLTIDALQTVFNEYDNDIKIAVTEDETISAIAKITQHIAQAHPFEDGNIRTVYIAMNKLLRDHGLRLSILLDPNRLDCCDLDLIVTMIKEGQGIYATLLNHTHPDEFQAATSDPNFKTISCPAFAMESPLRDQFLQEVVLSDMLPSQDNNAFSFFKSEHNKIVMRALPNVFFKRESCRPLIAKHMLAENYDIALRNACLHGECSVIIFLVNHIPALNLNGQSTDGSTALDYLEKHHSDNVDICTIKSHLRDLGALTQAQLLQNSPK